MGKDTTHREEGVDFTALNPVLEELEYPRTKAELLDAIGSQTVERTNADPIGIDELFAGTGEDTFETPDDVRQSILNLMPKESVGRQRYSDRGGSGPKEVPGEGGRADESI